MINKLIVAAAGSGKTTYLIREALKACDKKVLITTYTDSNKLEIQKKFLDLNGIIPENVSIQTWFSFLIQHGVKPYQSVIYSEKIKGLLLVNKKSGVRFIGRDKCPVYFPESDPSNYYFSKTKFIYSDKLSKFVVRANEKTNGLVIKRIEKIYSHIFIDEVQDMAGYDLDIIKLLFNSKCNVLLVGDPRQVTYHTHDEARYKKYADGKIIDFVKKECSSCPVEIDETTLNTTYRNNKEICFFANLIYNNFKACQYEEKRLTGHDGVFFVSKLDVESYLYTYHPMQLRYSQKTKVNTNYPVMNFGESKGLTFERVLIYPTNNMIKWIFNHNEKLGNQIRSKFYVAVTRAKYSVGIVFDNPKNIVVEGIKKYSPNNMFSEYQSKH